jgi:hypothetical protein
MSCWEIKKEPAVKYFCGGIVDVNYLRYDVLEYVVPELAIKENENINMFKVSK